MAIDTTLDESGILTLTFNRPEKKNAFNKAMWQQFGDALLDAKTNPKVACVLLYGAGGHFSSGMDLNDFDAGGDHSEHPFYRAQEALCFFDKPLIGAASGIAIGGGASILIHCDKIFVSDSLKMRFPFVSLGLVPEFAASFILQALIGSRKAADLMYTAKWIDAETAFQEGIATAVINEDELLEQAIEHAKAIAKWPVSSLQATKQSLKASQWPQIKETLAVERAAMDKLAGSQENIEAVVAFMKKREPNFKQFRQL